MKKIRNFKRKVTSSTKKTCPDSVEEFYVLKNDIGPNSAAIGLSIFVFDKILSENYDDSTHKLKGECVTNKVALEIFRYNNKDLDYQYSDKCKVLSFLSGKESLCNKTLFSRLTFLKGNAMRKIAPHERKDLKILLENSFEFPKSTGELFKDRLQIERNQFDKKYS